METKLSSALQSFSNENPANETIKTIYSRRAVRKYTDQPVSKILVQQIIDAGRMAPSAMNKQPLKFYVLSNKGSIDSFEKQIGKASMKAIAKMGIKSIIKSVASALTHPHDLSFLKDGNFIFHGAPCVIFITAPKDNEWSLLDAGACMQNMMIAAKALGLDTCPVGLAKFVEDTKLYSTLKISNDDHVVIAIIIGYGNENPEIHERKKENLFFVE